MIAMNSNMMIRLRIRCNTFTPQSSQSSVLSPQSSRRNEQSCKSCLRGLWGSAGGAAYPGDGVATCYLCLQPLPSFHESSRNASILVDALELQIDYQHTSAPERVSEEVKL